MNFEGKLIGSDLKVAIVVSRFNDFITNRLLDGAKDTLIRHEVPEENIDVAYVPGAFEIPLVAKKLAEKSDYDAIMIVGGHGAMFDLAHDENLHAVINVVHETGGIVSAVCHGPAPLVFTKTKDGKPLLQGLKVTGYPNDMEPEEVDGLLPFSLEDEMAKIAQYDKGDGQDEYFVWGSDRLLTGRDPGSSQAFGRELAKKLSELEEHQLDKHLE